MPTKPNGLRATRSQHNRGAVHPDGNGENPRGREPTVAQVGSKVGISAKVRRGGAKMQFALPAFRLPTAPLLLDPPIRSPGDLVRKLGAASRTGATAPVLRLADPDPRMAWDGIALAENPLTILPTPIRRSIHPASYLLRSSPSHPRPSDNTRPCCNHAYIRRANQSVPQGQASSPFKG